jgi:enamine deaminase RidA (YjgF/YER057c/UK114 family)
MKSREGYKVSKVEEKILELGLELPKISTPIASYIPAKKVGNLVFTSGQLPMVNGELTNTGFLGKEVSIEDANRAAQVCTLNALAAVKGVIGDLDQIKSIIRVVGYVSSTPEFTKQPAVVNGASDLLLQIFGDEGKHARSAIGVSALPLNAPVEIELTVEI